MPMQWLGRLLEGPGSSMVTQNRQWPCRVSGESPSTMQGHHQSSGDSGNASTFVRGGGADSTRSSPGDRGWLKASLPSCYGTFWNVKISLPHELAQGNLTHHLPAGRSAGSGHQRWNVADKPKLKDTDNEEDPWAPIAAFCFKQLDCGFTRWQGVEGWAAIQEGVKGDHGEATRREIEDGESTPYQLLDSTCTN
ncbi:hypothetical protein BC829DRAFT_418121 [Chytridium lagenaria]|nr:hypothetical protein BC829DRAFT_418121 [Chytridium lagenaria]